MKMAWMPVLTELDWNKRKWELRSDYWCER